MEYLSITGGNPLYGTAEIPAAKNSVLPIMAAAFMLEGTNYVHNVPRLSDVAVSMEILGLLGCDTQMLGNTLSISRKTIAARVIPAALMAAMRSSVFYLAPLLIKEGYTQISPPGGCNIGSRPIDIHLDGLSKMGVKVSKDENTITLDAKNGIKAVDYTLRLPSVGATETLIMAASQAKGQTVLRGPAKEPEIQDLASFLRSAGAIISGDGTDIIKITGVDALGNADYTPYGDRITAATVLCGAALCGGEVCAEGIAPRHTSATLAQLVKLGCGVKSTPSSVTLSSTGRLFSVGALQTGVYPDFCTDAAPLVAAVLLKAEGESSITDTIFESRFACAEGFNALGARAKANGRTVVVKGVSKLRASAIQAPDLRGGAALVIAALAAQGTSSLTGVSHIKRGYEDIAQLFGCLGADIKFIH